MSTQDGTTQILTNDNGNMQYKTAHNGAPSCCVHPGHPALDEHALWLLSWD